MHFSLVFVAALAASASALTTLHAPGLHHRYQHAALAKARSPVPDPVAAPSVQPDASAVAPQRKLRKRCKARKAPSSLESPSASAPINVGVAPSSSKPSSPPPPSQSQAAPPKPAPSQDPAPNPPPVSGGDSNSLFSGTHNGDGTYYGTGLGACGITNKDSDLIAAASEHLFDIFPGYNGGNPNLNPICGKKVRAEYQGKSVEVTITDRCVACSPTSLDFSPTAFGMLADLALGRIQITWTWVS